MENIVEKLTTNTLLQLWTYGLSLAGFSWYQQNKKSIETVAQDPHQS